MGKNRPGIMPLIILGTGLLTGVGTPSAWSYELLPPGALFSEPGTSETTTADPQPAWPAAPAAGLPSNADAIDVAQEQRLSQLEAELLAMRAALQAEQFETPAPAAATTPPTPNRQPTPPTPSTPPAPTTAPKFAPTTKLTGFFQADMAYFSQDTASRGQLGHIDNDLGFRRARLAAVGDVAPNVGYSLEMDFAFPGRPSFMDVWMEVRDVGQLGNVRVGQWRQPFGLDELTSVRELTFFERPTMFALAPFRQTGIGFANHSSDERVTWATSVYGFPTDFFGDHVGDSGFGTAARLTELLIDECDGRRIFHAGAGHVWTHPGATGSFYRNVPEYGGPFGGANGTVGSVPFFVNTGTLSDPNAHIINLELAGVSHSLHWQGEARYAFVDVNDTVVTLPSAYAQVGYLLTGEVRPYNKANATLGRIKPLRPFGDRGGLGAWEIAARYSYIDLNPAEIVAQVPPVGQPAFGGRLNDTTLGLNWYLNDRTKFQFQYVQAMLDRGGIESDTNIAAFRAQLDF